MITDRHRALLRNSGGTGLVDISSDLMPKNYAQSQYDYNALNLTELPEPETVYRFVVDAEMPEGVRLAIALGPSVAQNILSFSLGQNGVEVGEMKTVQGNYRNKRFFVRHSGGTGIVSFTIRSIHIYKLPDGGAA